MKSTVMATKSALPLMHMVAPRGTTNPETWGGKRKESSQTSSVVGNVALEEAVEKPVRIAVEARRKKSNGDQPANTFTSIG